MVEGQDLPVVTITGLTGFIGSYLGLYFLRDGGFKVRGTVRSTQNEAKLAPLREAYGELFAKVELVEADLMDTESLKRAIAGSTYVVHCASPVSVDMSAGDDFFVKPAVGGTEAVLQAAKENGVKRVCVTSSLAAILDMDTDPLPEVFTEEHWSSPPLQTPYGKSKTLAERAAWDFVEKEGEACPFTLTTICPGIVVGPPIIRGSDYISATILKMILLRESPAGLPRLHVSWVDVREVAQAHLECIKREEAQGKRFILNCQSLWFTEAASIIDSQFRPLGYDVATHEARLWLVKIAALFNGEARSIVAYWGRKGDADNAQSRSLLGINYRPIEETLQEMIMSMIEKGDLPDKRGQPVKRRCCGK